MRRSVFYGKYVPLCTGFTQKHMRKRLKRLSDGPFTRTLYPAGDPTQTQKNVVQTLGGCMRRLMFAFMMSVVVSSTVSAANLNTPSGVIAVPALISDATIARD